MKTLPAVAVSALGALTLALVPACAALEPVMIQTDGAVGRTIQRVLDRHDVYVEADEALSEGSRVFAQAQSEVVRGLIGMEVNPETLEMHLMPVMARHDVYVAADPELDDFERSVHLADSRRLRDLIAAAK